MEFQRLKGFRKQKLLFLKITFITLGVFFHLYPLHLSVAEANSLTTPQLQSRRKLGIEMATFFASHGYASPKEKATLNSLIQQGVAFGLKADAIQAQWVFTRKSTGSKKYRVKPRVERKT